MLYAIVALATIPSHPRHEAQHGDSGKPSSAAGYRTMLHDRRYLVFLAAMLFNAIIYTQYLSTLPLDVNAHRIAIFWYTLAVSLNAPRGEMIRRS